MFDQIPYSHHTRYIEHLEIESIWEMPVRGIARSNAIFKPVDMCKIAEQHAATNALPWWRSRVEGL